MKDYFVYCLCAENCATVYVGSTINLKDRVISHAYQNKVFSRVFYIACESEDQMLSLEKQFIAKFKPMYNKMMYSVAPYEGGIVWCELENSEFIDYVKYRNYLVYPAIENANSSIHQYIMNKDIMKLRYLYSRTLLDNSIPERVEFSSSDKLIYTYVKTRYDFHLSVGDEYMETQQQIAESVGVDSKTVARFMKKMKTHGFIDYSTNNAGNRVLYKFIADLV